MQLAERSSFFKLFFEKYQLIDSGVKSDRKGIVCCQGAKISMRDPYSIKVVQRAFNPLVRVQFPIWILFSASCTFFDCF